jgi:hypothetical protein
MCIKVESQGLAHGGSGFGMARKAGILQLPAAAVPLFVPLRPPHRTPPGPAAFLPPRKLEIPHLPPPVRVPLGFAGGACACVRRAPSCRQSR